MKTTNTYGLVKNKKPTTLDSIKERLQHVINPLTGLDIQKGNLVKKIDIINRIITVDITITFDHQFAGNLKDEITELLKPLWDIKEVNFF